MRRLFGFTKKSSASATEKDCERAPTAPPVTSTSGSGRDSRQDGKYAGLKSDASHSHEASAGSNSGSSSSVNNNNNNPSRNRDTSTQRQVAFASPPASAESSEETLRTAHLADVQNGPLYSHSQRSASSTPTAAGTHQQPHSEPSLPSPPLSRGRHGEAPSQSQHKHPSAPFPSYPFAPSTDQHPSRSHTPASQQGHETAALYRSISPLSNATTTAGSGYQFNRQAFLAQSLAGRSAAGPNNSSSTALQAPLTWAELADPDLVDNLGGRERTRQEVLWEIVASEERYVHELISLVEHYVKPLLYPARPTAESSPNHSPGTSSIASTSPRIDQSHSADSNFYASHQPRYLVKPNPGSGASMRRDSSQSITDASDALPIAARFARTLGSSQDSGLALSTNSNSSAKGAPRSQRQNSFNSQSSKRPPVGLGIDPSTIPSIEDDEQRAPSTSSQADHEHQRIQRKSSIARQRPPTSQSRYQQSTQSTKGSPPMPPPKDTPPAPATSTKPQTILRHHLKSLGPPSHNKLHRSDKAMPASERTAAKLPEPLRVLLTVILDHLVGRHEQLSALLQERWMAQYPLVRSLSDIWVEQSWMVHDYGIYVLHLEKSLQTIETAMASVHPQRKSKHFTEEEKETRKLAKQIIKLEEQASASGEGSLAICLSKPFQRLLKYPLLFQNLLYHTDASTVEYEGTQKLAIEIDRIVRSIESEKVSEEERDRLRDLFARIDHINDKALMVPLKERFLLEEFPVWGASLQSRSVSDVSKTPQEKPTHLRPPQSSDGAASAGGKPKKTVRRFSDMVNSSEKDKKPPSMGSKKDIWIIRLSDVVLKCQRVGITTRPLGAALTKDSKGRKHTGPKRNLYRFLNVERWEPQLAYGHPAPVSATMVVDDEDAHDEEEEEVDEFDSQGGPSRMSFSYADDEPRPVLAPLPHGGARTFHGAKEDSNSETTPKHTSGAQKFGTRLRGSAGGPATPAMRSPTPTVTPMRRRPYEAPTTAQLNKMKSSSEKRAPDLSSSQPAPGAPAAHPSSRTMTESTSTGSLAHSSSAARLYASYANFVNER